MSSEPSNLYFDENHLTTKAMYSNRSHNTQLHAFLPPQQPQATPPPPPPTSVPALVYRVHRTTAQTRYNFSTGFTAKNQTTIVNYPSCLSRFGLAHLTRQTNISSPFISVYDNLTHAEAVAKHFADRYKEDTFVVTVDTRHLARGPVFRAADLLAEGAGADGKTVAKRRDSSARCDEEEDWLHYGEYLLMYRIPAQAIRDQTPVVKVSDQKWRAPGVIGGA